MEEFISNFINSKEWLYTGVIAAAISIIANILTAYITSKRNKEKNIKMTVTITGKDGKKHKISIDNEHSETELLETIKSLKGSDYVEPKPNKQNQADS